MDKPRSAGRLGREFPYTLRTMCYFEVSKDGVVRWGRDGRTYARAMEGSSRLYAVWPGEWSSHLFVIDDLDQYAKAFDIIHDVERTGLLEHEHDVSWQIHPQEDNPGGSYITINVTLECGCEIRNLKTFAAHMKKQSGWDVATTSGWGGAGASADSLPTYYVRARRKSLDPPLKRPTD